MAALSSKSNDQDNRDSKNSAIWSKLRRLSSLTGRGDNNGVITTEGYLFKMKRSAQVIKLSDWNRRYFTIEGDYLCWRHANDRSTPSGSVKISDIKSIKTIKQNKCAFVVKAGERTLYLRSETAGDADRWVRSIQMQVDLRTGGTSQGPKGEKNRRRSNGGMDKFDHMIREVEKSLEVLEKLDEESGMSGKKKPSKKRGGGGATGSSSSSSSSKRRGEDDGHNDESGAAWGGRLQFENDKSILEPVSPLPGGVGRGRDRPTESADSELELSGGSIGSGSGRKDYSSMRAKASPSASESSESHSPSGFNTVDYQSVKRGGMESINPKSGRHGNGNGTSTHDGVSLARPAYSPPERNRNKKHSMRKDLTSTPTMKNSGGRNPDPASPDFSSPSSIVTSTMSDATPYSPIVTSKKKKKKRESGSSRSKKREEWDRFESSGEFSASFESEELNESPLKPKNLSSPAAPKQLEEFEDLEELEKLSNNRNREGGKIQLRKGGNRVSLVRSGEDGPIIGGAKLHNNWA
ncbi:hypothetical protein TrST_g9849 [Triparma strigata]|uniref:PH domain-containing protein n=1 Tax=Triparma strigata TaxID=1606541 RepID=A0A9W7BJN5_9STRA|nr:hypothetical protein TrST_g9849 [Triparma strigata]